MKRFVVAFSSLPNTFHTGMLLGYARGAFEEKGLSIQFQQPDSFHFVNASAVKVATQQAHIGFASPFLVHSFLTHTSSQNICAVSAPVQHNFFAFALKQELTNENNNHVKLTGKRFAIQNAEGRLEELRSLLLKHEGQSFIRPVALEGAQALRTNTADLAYINTAWDALLLEEEGIKLSYIKRNEDELVLGYNPVYIANPNMWKQDRESYETFFEIANKEYLFASQEPLAAAKILHDFYQHKFPNFDKLSLLEQSLLQLSKSFVNEYNQWGCMSDYQWQEFLLANKQMAKANHNYPSKESHSRVKSHELFTNDLLPY